MPTDTIYGLVGQALKQKTVSRIYKVRHRNPKKPMIILIGSLSDLSCFGVKINARIKNLLNKIWPIRPFDKIQGKQTQGRLVAVSVILPCQLKKFAYLHRGTKTLAFRLPAVKNLRLLLCATGPLVAPSANPEGKKPAKNIKEAQKYFGKQADFYLNEGTLYRAPSTLIEIVR